MGTGMEDGEARLDYVRSLDAGHIGGLEVYINLYRRESNTRSLKCGVSRFAFCVYFHLSHSHLNHNEV